MNKKNVVPLWVAKTLIYQYCMSKEKLKELADMEYEKIKNERLSKMDPFTVECNQCKSINVFYHVRGNNLTIYCESCPNNQTIKLVSNDEKNAIQTSMLNMLEPEKKDGK
jgi:hypothetical protein